MSTIKISENIHQELEIFRAYLRKMEYTTASTIGYCTYLSRYLRQTDLSQAAPLNEAIKLFLEAEKTDHPKTFKDCRASLRLYYKMSTGDSLKRTPKPTHSPAEEAMLQRFCTFSTEIKHLEEGTVNSEISHVYYFLEYTNGHKSHDAVDLFTAEDIRSYVVERLAKLADSSKGRIVTSIRNFFRCQAFYGEPVHPSILRLPLSPAVWKKSAFPTTIDTDTFDSLCKIPDSTTKVGKRNRCIILCFTMLGLRCSEVAKLTVDDFHWHDGSVTIRKSKNGTERILPLPILLGNAIVEYLTQVRPKTMCRTFFVRFSHPCGEDMGCSQIRCVVRYNGAKAGLNTHFCGTHILRRTMATKLYNAGNSLKLTADILGHESLDSTTHYTKTDVARLMSVAAPWPGGDRND